MFRPLFHGITVRGTHCVGGWVGFSASLDAVEKKEICCFSRRACSPSLYRLSYPDSTCHVGRLRLLKKLDIKRWNGFIWIIAGTH
jgi:hypothetical protein